MKQLKIILVISLALAVPAPFSGAALHQRYDIPVGDSPVWGADDAPVTIIEFIDYQ